MSRRIGPLLAVAMIVGSIGLTIGLGTGSTRAGAVTSARSTLPITVPRATTTQPAPSPTTALSTATTRAVTATTKAPVATTSHPAGGVGGVTPTSSFLVPTTTVAPATTTTIRGINGQIPNAPKTIPLETKGTNGHVDPTFAWLSGIGFAIALLIVGSRLFVTRPGGRDRAPLI
jgi:hypothetical protein